VGRRTEIGSKKKELTVCTKTVKQGNYQKKQNGEKIPSKEGVFWTPGPFRGFKSTVAKEISTLRKEKRNHFYEPLPQLEKGKVRLKQSAWGDYDCSGWDFSIKKVPSTGHKKKKNPAYRKKRRKCHRRGKCI